MQPTATVIFALCLAWLGLFGKLALDMWKNRDRKAMPFWMFISFLPVSVAMLWIIPQTAGPNMAKDLSLGLIGAVLGASLFVWCGRALSDGVAKPDAEQSPALQNSPGTPMPENNKQKCVSTGIKIEGGSDIEMSDNQFSGIDCAIDVRNAKGVKAHNNTVK